MVYKRVTTLDMSNNRIVKLHPDFGMLDQLTKLDLSNNRLKTLSGSIGKLTQLRHLDLYGNEIEHLPLELGLLRNLRLVFFVELHLEHADINYNSPFALQLYRSERKPTDAGTGKGCRSMFNSGRLPKSS